MASDRGSTLTTNFPTARLPYIENWSAQVQIEASPPAIPKHLEQREMSFPKSAETWEIQTALPISKKRKERLGFPFKNPRRSFDLMKPQGKLRRLVQSG
jgi:hypothetical protein